MSRYYEAILDCDGDVDGWSGWRKGDMPRRCRKDTIVFTGPSMNCWMELRGKELQDYFLGTTLWCGYGPNRKAAVEAARAFKHRSPGAVVRKFERPKMVWA